MSIPNGRGSVVLKNDTGDTTPKKYYGISFLILLACNFIYMIPHFEHYTMGGLMGLVLLFFLGIIMLVADLILMFPLAALLRWVKQKSWWTLFVKIALGAVVLAVGINMYRATLPLPYLQTMIDKIPQAEAYFEENEAVFYEERTKEPDKMFSYNEGDIVGPMINMQYVYVENPEDYPQKTGQITRTYYIHPLNEHWYLELLQRGAI